MVSEKDTSECLQLHEREFESHTHSLTCGRAALGGGGGGGARGGGGGGGGTGMLRPQIPAETNSSSQSCSCTAVTGQLLFSPCMSEAATV